MHRDMTLRYVNCFTIILASAFLAAAQQAQPTQQQPIPADTNQNPTPAAGAPTRELPPDSIRPNYELGPSDQILIRSPQAEEINEKPFRIDSEGNLNLPLVGRIHAAGMTQQELETELIKRLKEYIRDPQVIITITAFRNEPVFFFGSFVKPGIYGLQGKRTLIEMLVNVGGLLPNASRRIKVTRRAEYGPIPLPNAIEDPEKKISTVEISMASLRENVNPAEDIILQPFDVISVERAESVYVNGEVLKTGAIELGERDSISLLQAVTQSGGFTRDAKRQQVRILRPIQNSTRRAEIDIDVNEIYSGRANDFPLLPNDVLYIPRSYKRVFWTTFGQILISSGPFIIVSVIR